MLNTTDSVMMRFVGFLQVFDHCMYFPRLKEEVCWLFAALFFDRISDKFITHNSCVDVSLQ